jgi:hypothetical protein
MAFLKRLIDEAGATSVLVILMMIVLVSLGYFAIASANSNIKLSDNALYWNARYYELDAEGENFIAAFDKYLANAQALTNEYMETEQYLEITHGNIPMSLQTTFFDGYPVSEDKNYFLDTVMDTVFLYYADIELAKFKEEYPDSTVSVLKEGDQVMAIICDMTFTSEAAPDFHLDVSATVNYLSEFVYAQAEGNLSMGRYNITKWTQWQNEPNTAQEGTKVWDGTITTP